MNKADSDRSLADKLLKMTVQTQAFSKDLLIDFLATQKAAVDTLKLAEENRWDHGSVVGAVKSLQATGAISVEAKQRTGWKCTEEGDKCIANGSPEVVVVADIAKHPSSTQDDLISRLGKDVVSVGFGQAMKNGWIEQNNKQPKAEKKEGEKKEKGPPPTFVVTVKGESPVDETRDLLKQVASDTLSDDKTLQLLKKRKLVTPQSLTAYVISKDPDFDKKARAQKGTAELTEAMIASGEWANANYKPLNFNAQGQPIAAGQLHPLLKVREHYRRTFMKMGFQEMKTNQFVESSFWNFDTLYQPQQHPARDAHDTFFCESPETANEEMIPKDYFEKVREMHQSGGHGSIGWRYTWSKEEALTTLLRTHTTANSSRVLYEHAQKCKRLGRWKPLKCFSVDRVFRNETLDATHLAEFHQAEGFIADKNLTLGHLIGVFKEFFAHINIKNLRFKPAYNPYTEPSMEIFGYHAGLKKTIEIGNSGIFRPEMLRPMGLPEDVRVIAWGVSLERPTMMLYNIKNIRDLVGEKIDVNTLKTNPVCWFPEPEEEIAVDEA